MPDLHSFALLSGLRKLFDIVSEILLIYHPSSLYLEEAFPAFAYM